jgi:hypothetical protein
MRRSVTMAGSAMLRVRPDGRQHPTEMDYRLAARLAIICLCAADQNRHPLQSLTSLADCKVASYICVVVNGQRLTL